MDNDQTGHDDKTKKASSEAWQEVGHQFQILGESLAAALRTSLNDEDSRKHMRSVQGNLESLVRQFDERLQGVASSPDAQKVKAEAQRTADTLREAGEQTVQEVRPHILSALRQVNDELQKAVRQMEERNQQRQQSTPPPADASEEKKQ